MDRKIKEITLLALATSILIVQETVLSFLPNIQFSVLLILVYTKVFGLRKTSIIILVHVFLDNLLMGSIGMPNIFIPMLIAWLLIALIFKFISKTTDNILVYAIAAYLFGHLYGIIFVPFQAFVIETSLLSYFIVDIPFQIIMGLSGFLSVFWLYQPLENLLNQLYLNYDK